MYEDEKVKSIVYRLEYYLEEIDKYGFPDEGTWYEYRSDSLHQWDGMLGELQRYCHQSFEMCQHTNCHRYKADVGVGAVFVATERENVVDFTLPWYERVGYQLMMKAFKDKTNKIGRAHV